MLIAQKMDNGTIEAGAERLISFLIPPQTGGGNYRLLISYRDLASVHFVQSMKNIQINGIKAAITATVNKEVFFSTESVDILSMITNQEGPLFGGLLDLKIMSSSKANYIASWGQNNPWNGTRQHIDTVSNPKSLQLEKRIKNGDFEYGSLIGWEMIRINGGWAAIQHEGDSFSYYPTDKIVFNGNYVVNIRSDGGGATTSEGVIISDPFIPMNDTLNWVQFSENPNIYFEVKVLDINRNTLKTVQLPIVSGYFGEQQIDISSYKGQTIRIQFRQHTNQSGCGWFTLLDDVRNGNAIFQPSGIFDSEVRDYGVPVDFGTVSWMATIPTGSAVKFQIAANNDNSTWNFVGPDGGMDSYYENSGEAINTAHNGNRYLRWRAYLTSSDTTITPILHSMTIGASETTTRILWQKSQEVNAPEGSTQKIASLVGSINTAGKYYLLASLKNALGQTLATSSDQFYVINGSIDLELTTNKKTYKPNESITITGAVKNLAPIEASNLAFTLKGKTAGGVEQIFHAATFTLPVGGSWPFTVTTTAGSEGIATLTGTVAQNGVTLSRIDDQYLVAVPQVTATLTGPNVVAGDAPFDLLLALTNTGMTDATLTVANSFNPLPETITVPAGETILRQYPQQISADTLYTFTVSGDLNQTLTKLIAYAAPAVASVSATVVTDKVAYNPQESVILTSAITASASIENPSAWIRISDSQGQDLYSERVNLPSLMQGQTFTLNKPWNSATHPAGTYQVSLQIHDGAGTVLTTVGCTLTLNAPLNPKSLLHGEVTLDRQHILTGEPLTVSCRMTNIGNVDLARIDLEIRTIGAVGQSVYATSADQTALAMGAVATKSGQIDTQGYSARDYLVLLLAKIDGVEEVLAGTYFRVEGAPSAPARIGPENGADVASFTPALQISNAADPNADRLTYEFEIYTDSGLTTLVVSGTASETVSSTLWNVTTPLTENQTYYWRARAYDGRLYGPWLEVSSFRVNTVNDPPTAPHISSPADGTSTGEFTPTLTVSNASDPDSSLLTYHFVVASDPDFTRIVAEGRAASGETMTAWTLPLPLEENGWYYWRAQADDLLAGGSWSATSEFLVNSANDPPTAPVMIAPVANSVLAAESTDVVASNSTDPDSPILSYYFEADTAATFDSAELLRSELVIAGQESTAWSLTGLQENTWYYLRAKASDGMAESPWSAVTGFFVNAVNEPPTPPVLDNPSDGSGVNLLTPTLSVRNAIDPDRDPLTYEFAVYTDAALTNLAVQADQIAQTPAATTWVIPWALTENQTYYWQARAADGLLLSDWMPAAAFMINTANDAPGAPQLAAPVEGMKVTSLTPVLMIVNSVDPDSDRLVYDFELYSGAVLIATFSNVAAGSSGITSVVLDPALNDESSYSWRVRAFDGDLYGPWMTMANFSTALPKATIPVEIKFVPETLNKDDEGQWVQVTIELPQGYKAADIALASLRLEGTIPAEPRPISMQRGKYADQLTVKFKRSQASAILPSGQRVPVHVTGKVGSTVFEGVDIIRVIDKKNN